MRFRSTAILIALAVLLPGAVFAQASGTASAPRPFITNYQFVNQVRINATQSDLTYRADVVNPGPAIALVTASLTSLDTSKVQVVQGQGFLAFLSVPAYGQTTSSNTFTVLVNDGAPLDFGNLQWTFLGPAANAGPNQTVNVGNTVTLDGSGSTNVYGTGMLTYSWAFLSRPGGSAAKLNNSTTALPSFLADVSGSYAIGLTVSNGAASSTASVTVSTLNTAPVANAGPNQNVAQGSNVVLNGSGSTDVDGDPLAYSWALISLPAGSAATLTGADTVSPSFVADQPGAYVVQLSVNDGKADSNPASVTITTLDPPPIANPGPAQNVSAGSLVQLNGSCSTDVDGDLLTYHWSFVSVPPGSTAVLSSATSVNPTFTADVPGTYVAQLIVNNGTFDSVPATVIVTTSVLLRPVANAGPSQHATINNAVTLSGAGADPQGLAISYQWSLIVKPNGSAASLSSSSAASPSFVPDLPGSYVAQLIVNNGYLSSSPSTVTSTTTNSPPLANAGTNQNVGTGSPVTLDGSRSSDPDNDALNYSWAFLSRPDGSAAALSAANSVSPTFVADAPGTYVVQLIANDGLANSNPTTVMITAVGSAVINLAPNPLALSINAPGPLTVLLPAPAGVGGQVVNLTTSDSGVAVTPASVTVPQGSTGANVTITPGIAGSATITASADGLGTATAIANVTIPITLALDSANVGVTRAINGTVTLGSPAPAGGVVLTLSTNPSWIVDLKPSTVTIAAGNSTGTFTVTGLAVGSTSVSAGAPSYSVGSANINVVNFGQIGVPVNLTVGLGQSVPFPITLPSPAPPGGATVLLASADTSKVTVWPASVNIPAGQTTPAVQPQVTGVDFGSVGISCSSSGYASVNQPVRVTASISFSPQTLSIKGNTSGNLTLNLSGPAPGGGLTVSLSSSDSTIASVPDSVTFLANATSLAIPVNGVATGSVVIHASAPPNLADTTANVTVTDAGKIVLLSTGVVVMGQTAVLSVNLPAPAPAPVNVVLISTDPSKLTVSPQTVFIPAGFQAPTTLPQLTGLGLGTVAVIASAPGYTVASQPIKVTIGASFDPIAVTMTGPSIAAVKLNLASPAPAGGLFVNLSSDNPSVATVPASITFAANAPSVTFTVTGIAPGTTVIHASALPNLPDTVAIVTVLNPDGTSTGGSGGNSGGSTGGTTTSGGIAISSASVGQNLQTLVSVTLPPTATSGLQLTVTSSDPTKLVVAGRLGDAGSGSLALSVPAGLIQFGVFVQALASSGSVTLTASADGVPSGTATITLTPSGFVLVGPGGFGASKFTTSQGLNTNLSVYAARLDSAFNFVETQRLRGGFTASVNVTSVNTTVGTITLSPLVFSGGDQFATTQFSPANSGSTSITASVPAGFSTPAASGNTVTANVTPAGLIAPNASVGKNLETEITLRLNGVPSSSVVVTVASNGPSLMLLSTSAQTAGSAQITITIPPGQIGATFFAQGLASSGIATYSVSAAGYGTATGTVTLAPSGIFIYGQQGGLIAATGTGGVGLISFKTGDILGPAIITIASAMLDSAGNILDSTQPIAGGSSVNVNVTSSNTAAGTISPTALTILGGSNTATTVFQPVGNGTTTISIDSPAGFTTPARFTSATVQVIE